MQGLSQIEATRRLRVDGPNALPADNRRSLFGILWETLHDPMFALLLFAGVLYLVLGDWHEGLVLFGLVIVVLALTLYQEGKTERAMQALRDLSNPRALVIRDGEIRRIAGREVVRGDVMVLVAGDRVAADAVLLSGAEVQVDESLLTGESVAISKTPFPTTDSASSLAPPAPEKMEPHHCLYAGSLLVQGHAQALVFATGSHSQMGRIGVALISLSIEHSPLKQQTAKLIRVLAILAFAASAFLVLLMGWVRGDWLAAFLGGIALAMAMLPQEFSVVLTVLPALGAWRLSKQNVLTRRISAIATLGSASVLCVDKTGTLTENRMTVARLYAPNAQESQDGFLNIDYAVPSALPEAFHALVEYAILGSATDPFDPMEKAFHRLGTHFLQGTEHLHGDWTLMREYGLTPELRAMAHVWKSLDSNRHIVAAKGAPEAIIDLCHLDPKTQQEIAAAVDAMAASGLRVLGVAQARFEGEDWPAIEHDFDFEFIGLLGMADPLRAEVTQAVQACHSAGIKLVMITGDYPATARSIASQAGLRDGELLTGDEMAQLSDTELQQRMGNVTVCARIAPEQKLRIVQALKALGAIVAMTGDGVNDAPALKAAHVGIAMGGRGTDVAREAAALVLLDDNFASIVRAVQLGRRIFDNLRKSMSYILAVHIPIAGMALLPVLFGWPVVLFPLHIAFLELVIDPACSMVFEAEPAEQNSMQHAPRDVQLALLDNTTLALALLQGGIVLAMSLLGYAWAANSQSPEAARAFAFTTMVIGNIALILANRSHQQTIFGTLRVANPVLWSVIGLTLALLLLTIYVPWLARLFYFDALSTTLLAQAVALGAVSVVWFEILKFLRRFNP